MLPLAGTVIMATSPTLSMSFLINVELMHALSILASKELKVVPALMAER
jgi:hypothetical protein